ncbi:MAG: asparaginase [Pseudomonadota bacterium]
MNPLVPLLETLRGGTLECMHYGAIAVCDAQGKLVAQAGDPHWVTFPRSAIKPFQALPFVQSGGARQLGFTPSNLALMCASHSGEPMHVAQVDDMLGKAGVGYKALQCGCHVPFFADLGLEHTPAPGSFDERNHNCSGKHTGFLAYCKLHGLPLETYLDPGHPLQQAVRDKLARVTGLRAEDLRAGTDGCSAPAYAMPLSALARGYARFATGAADAEFGESFVALGDAMTAHPDLVSGTGRLDKDLMRAGNGDWISKAGADGVQVVASRSRKQAVAVKVIDGSKQAVCAAAVAALDQLGWLDDAQRQALWPWRAESIRSFAGRQVGERQAVFALRSPH